MTASPGSSVEQLEVELLSLRVDEEVESVVGFVDELETVTVVE